VSGIIKMSEMLSIALHSMVFITSFSKDIVSVKDIAEKTGFSENHLSKVLQRMVKADLLKSVRGPKGGFLLAKKPEKITLLNIYEIIEGPINIEECPFGRAACPFNSCIFENVVSDLNERFLNYLKEHTLKDFEESL
jgi:Rrf2 family protein